MFNRKLLTSVCAVFAITAVSAATVKNVSVSTNSQKAAKLIDNDCSDGSYWNAASLPHTLEFQFAEAEILYSVSVYPGCRSYADFPSTECGPKELKVWGLRDGKYIQLTEQEIVTLPRDHRKSEDFVVEIPLKAEKIQAVKLEIVSTHDIGNRNGATTALPLEKRTVNIREVKFKTLAAKQAQDLELAKKFAEMNSFLAEYDKFIAQKNILTEAIKEVWGERVELLRKLVADRNDVFAAERNLKYLQRQVLPYFALKNADSLKKGALSLNLKIVSDNTISMPATFPLHYGILDKIFGRKLSRFNVKVEAQNADGTKVLIRSRVDNLTPARANLVWQLLPGASSYKVTFVPYQNGEKPLNKALIGDGDTLMVDRVVTQILPWNFWNVRFHDLLGDGTKQLIAGRWTDYAHIYRNLGTNENPKYHESEHYIVLDSFDTPVGTTDHHGLAFSLVECADLDGDGKLDMTLQRTYDTMPIFLRNTSKNKGELAFADPENIPQLNQRYRYTFGDLNGDGLADVLGIRMQKATPEVVYALNCGMNGKKIPQFSKFEKLSLNIPDSKESTRSIHSYKAVPYLIDLNNDGLLDLSVSLPPQVLVLFNEGDAKNFKFGAPQVVKHLNGKEFANEFYYTNVGWGDINGDGLCDLFTRVVNNYWISKGSVLTVEDNPTKLQALEKQQALSDVYVGLANFQLFDIDNDGKFEFCQLNNAYNLQIYRLDDDGKFDALKNIPLEGRSFQRYGCMDHNEYQSFYAQMLMYDFDGDKKLDVLLNTEHNFTFGYYSLYLNQGDYKFGKELQVTPKLDRSHMKTVKSPKGKAVEATPDSNLDFLSFETANLLDLEAGKIEFNFASSRNTFTRQGRTLFSSVFWDKKLYSTSTKLYEAYRKCSDVAEFLNRNPGFALVQLRDGKIRCQIGNTFMETKKPVELKKDRYHNFKVIWNKKGVKLLIDNRVVASTSAQLQSIAERFHLGSMAALSLQYNREYPDRRKSHPYDLSTPAYGYFEDLTLYNAKGEKTLALDFEKDFGPMEKRSALSYRCNPAVTENYNGKCALVAHMDDYFRIEIPNSGNPKARLYVIPFTKNLGKAPTFDKPIPLNHADGKPFYAHSRTNIHLYDWNKDGFEDIILATENHPNNYNIGIELFLNDGKWNFIRTRDAEITRLNDLMTAHHDIKMQFVNLTGGEESDILTWTDPGIRLYSRNYLKFEAPKFVVE
ncbi:MAG: VCBS repeat-containing protein [Lentisphaeria bacterium]|nr:VCBS repeat-containing protein [Lentisphaeria bacterium]